MEVAAKHGIARCREATFFPLLFESAILKRTLSGLLSIEISTPIHDFHQISDAINRAVETVSGEQSA